MAHCPYSYFHYRIQAGDTFASLAETYNVTEQMIRDYNMGRKPIVGQRIRIPCACGGCTRGAFYAIHRGETLFKIACRNGLTLAELLEANPYLNPNYYVPGQVIIIPPAPPRQRRKTYTLAPNEGLFDVLRRFHMDLTTFCTMNPGVNVMGVKGGDTVYIKVPKQTDNGQWYTIADGEDLVAVAQRHNVAVSKLLGANENMRPADFNPGAYVRIPRE